MIRVHALAALLLAAACHAAPPPPPDIHQLRTEGHNVQGGLVFGVAPPGTRLLRLDGKPVSLNGDGRFVIGFARDAPPRGVMTFIGDGGATSTEPLEVKAREWQVESIPSLSVGSGKAEPAAEARRAAETARITAARHGELPGLGWTQAFAWPATGRISGVYGSQRILGGVPASPHYGVDIAVPAGTPVLAPAGGVVRMAEGPFSLEGNLIMLDHGHGLVSAFLHLSRIDVTVGQVVKRGDALGAVGTTGRSTAPHLHWAMTWTDVRVDPQLLVPPMPERDATVPDGKR